MIKKLQTDNCILQKYFFENFQHINSVEKLNMDKILEDLKQYDSLQLTNIGLSEHRKENDYMVFDGSGYLILDIEDIKSTIEIYRKSHELITKYNLPTRCDSYKGKTLNRVVQYSRTYYGTETTLLIFTDNTFYFVGESCADKDYDHEPRLAIGFFCYGYHFFKYIGNEEIANEWEAYRKEIKYTNKS